MPNEKKQTAPPAPTPDPSAPKAQTPQQRPTIGRIVHFVVETHDDREPQAGIQMPREDTCAALVVGVYPDPDLADLEVFLPLGHPMGERMRRARVPLAHDYTANAWTWPPRS
jgi:hypothetical protein